MQQQLLCPLSFYSGAWCKYSMVVRIWICPWLLSQHYFQRCSWENARPVQRWHLISAHECKTTSQVVLLNLCLSRWSCMCMCMCVFFPFWQGTLHHPYISFYDAFYLIHHPLMTSYPTWLERERAVYPTAALTSPIFISIFGNKTVMLSSINNLSTLLYQAAISVHGGAPAFWIILLQDGAPPNERLIDSLLTFFDYATFQENLIWNVDRTT